MLIQNKLLWPYIYPIFLLNQIAFLTMQLNPRGFKFKTILDSFTWDLLLILNETLIADTVDMDTLKLRILMTLSDVQEQESEPQSSSSHKPRRPSYVKNLLFRDFSAPKDTLWHSFHLPASGDIPACNIKLHDEAINYLTHVLERRLTLAQNLKEKPTNAHNLFVNFAHHSACHTDWQTAKVQRHRDNQSMQEEVPYFHDSTQRLIELRNRLGSDFGDISQRRREQYGPIWLVVKDCKAEMPEELSLFDNISALPLALNPEFMHDPELQKSLVRVLDSLNERYKLLRSTGLKPNKWLERTQPSISVLRELKRLRTEANVILKTGAVPTILSAYRLAFDQTLISEQRKKLAGCTHFEQFTQNEYGMDMLNYSALSLDQGSQAQADEELSLYEAIPGTDFEEEWLESLFSQFDQTQDWVQYLIKTRPELFDEVMTIFFCEVIGSNPAQEPISDKHSLLKDRPFRKLLQTHPHFQRVDESEWAEQLVERAANIIEKGIQLCENSRSN